MKARSLRKIATISLLALLITTLFVIANSDVSRASSTGSDEVSAASGANRFVVWQDITPGNFDILFKRSTDNGATWKTTVNLSKNPGQSTHPEMIVSGSTVYVVWLQQNTDGTHRDTFFRRSTDNGVTWGAAINISVTGTNSVDTIPQLAASGSNVYIIWHDMNPDNFEVFIRRSLDGGATWNAKVNLSSNPGHSFYPQIAVSGSHVYVAWNQVIAGPHIGNTGYPNIFFRKSSDGGATWGAKINISNTGTVQSPVPDIAVSGNNVYLVWGDTDVLFRRSTDRGVTWKPIIPIGGDGSPQIAVSSGAVHVTWGDGDVFFRRSINDGATWQAIKNLSNTPKSSLNPQIATAGSNVYIAWSEENADGVDAADILFRRSTDDGATWKLAKNVSNDPGYSYLSGQQIAVSGSNVYVVWVRACSFDRCDFAPDVFFNRSIDSGATWKMAKNLSNSLDSSLSPQIAV